MNRPECPRSGPRRGLICLLLAALLLALASAACSNPEKAKAAHVARGQQYLKEKKYPEAELEFRNAIQIDDNLVAAHWGLAQAYEGQTNILPAIQELKRAVDLDKDLTQPEAATHLGNYYMAAYGLNRDKQLRDLAQKLADQVLRKYPDDIEGHILRAAVLFADGKRDEALAALKHAVDLNPQRVESLMSLARFYGQTGDAGNAEATYRRALAANDRSALAHMQYGYFLVQQQRNEQAEAELRKAVEVEPDNREARRTLASFYISLKQFDRAEEVVKAWADLDKARPEGRAVLADFYSTIGRDADALRVYQEIVAQAPDYTRGRYRLGEIMLQRGDVAGAQAQAKAVLDKNPNDGQALRLRARAYLQEDEARKAAEDLAQVLKAEPRDQTALYFMAQAQIGLKQIEQARSYAGDLEKYYPEYLPGKLLQAQIALRAAENAPDPATAADQLKTARQLATDMLNILGRGTPDPQLTPELAVELRSKAYTARAAAEVRLKDFAAARADFTAARDAAPNAPASYVNLAGVALAEQKAAEAEQLYERALQIDGANLEALGGLVNLALAQGQPDRAHQRLDQALGAHGDSAGLHFLKAQVYGVQAAQAARARDEAGKTQFTQGAERELRRSIELDPNNPAALTALAALYVNLGQPDRAVTEYRNVIARPPDTDDAAAFTLIGMVEDLRNNRDAAVAAYKDALARNPDPAIAAIAGNNLAWNYAEYGKGNLDEAVRYAQEVVRQYPGEPGYADTLGWVYYKKGIYGAAVEQLQKAVEQTTTRGGDSAVYRLHLGLALAKAGRKSDARQQLQQAVQLGTDRGLTAAQVEEARQTLGTLGE
ncbi:MAG TPA: tetratricopeptide repeat protein [Pyrinomonadaceae bacterium]|jgi:tetratricopeptide (TPR) repeat protein